MGRAAAAAMVCFALVGCFGGEDRAERHAEQAVEHLDAGRFDEALIDLHSALKLDPTSADYAEQIATLLALRDDLDEARFYFGETYRLDPSRERAVVNLALLLFGSDPDQANALLDEVLARDPNSGWGWIGRAEQALLDFDTEAALAAAQASIEFAPDLADTHWELARVHIARIRERSLQAAATDDSLFDQALAALDRFGEADPSRSWQALAERARVLAAWRDHEDEAEAALRGASAELQERRLWARELELLDVALALARTHERLALEQWALERKVEITPRDYASWEELAALQPRLDGHPAAIYRRMIEQLPDETDPHIRYARHIHRKRGLDAAKRYLLGKTEEGFDGASLMAEKARLQLRDGNRQAAFATVERLQNEYPDSRQSVTMLAWGLVETGRPDAALELLSQYDWTADDPGAMRIVIDAHVRKGDSEAALAAVEQLIERVDVAELRLLRTRARLLHDSDRCSEARRAYTTLSRRTRLRPEEVALRARCIIETGGGGVGIRMLEQLVDGPNPPPIAVFELYGQQRTVPHQRERLRSGLAKVLAEYPDHPGALGVLVQLEVAAGSPDDARPAIEAAYARAIEAERPAEWLSLLLAHLDAASGNRAAARTRALAILDSDARQPGALELAVSLYPTKEDASAAIRELTAGSKNVERPASHHALLGRLYYRADNPVMARWSYEQALTGGLELPILKNDLAFLLASQGHDLERARLLARQAVEAMPNEPGVIDTLGFVLLEMGEYDNALIQFRRAIEVAAQRSLPPSTMRYHEGLALTALDRSSEAEQAFAQALEAESDFPEEAEARRELAILRGEI